MESVLQIIPEIRANYCLQEVTVTNSPAGRAIMDYWLERTSQDPLPQDVSVIPKQIDAYY